MMTKGRRWSTLVLAIALAALGAACAKKLATVEPSGRLAAPPPGASPGRLAPPTAGSRPEGFAADASRVASSGGGRGAAFSPGASGVTSRAAAARPTPGDFAPVRALQDIFFDFDRYAIRADAERVLTHDIDWMQTNRQALILIEGHCDERGTAEYNLALGERRAQAAADYLVSRGVAANRITVVSYGKERPVCREQTEECWARNRRAHFLAKQM